MYVSSQNRKKVKCRVASRPEGSKVLVHKSAIPPRAAIYYKGGTEIVMVDNLTSADCVVGLLRNGPETVVIASVYLDINLDPVPSWLEKVANLLRQKVLHY